MDVSVLAAIAAGAGVIGAAYLMRLHMRRDDDDLQEHLNELASVTMSPPPIEFDDCECSGGPPVRDRPVLFLVK